MRTDCRAELLVVALALLAGCEPAPRRPDAPDSATGRPVGCFDSDAASATASGTIWFAMTDIAIDQNDSPDVPHTGFNLDNLYSDDTDMGGCTHPDYYALFDDHQHCMTNTEACPAMPNPGCRRAQGAECRGGVDNQFPTGATTLQDVAADVDLRTAARQEVSAGRFVILLEVFDVDDCLNDTSVRVRIFRGFAAPGTACAMPGREATYQIDRASLRPQGSTADDAIVDLPGVMQNGHVRVVPEMSTDRTVLPLRWPARARPPQAWIDLPTHRPLVAFDLAAGGGTRGNFGGWVAGADAAVAIATIVPGYGLDQIQQVVGGIADIMVNGVCDDESVTPARLGGVSIGFGFDLVRVRIDDANPVVDAPMPGSCEFAGTALDGGAD